MKKYYIVSSIIMLLCLACAHYTAREQAMIMRTMNNGINV